MRVISHQIRIKWCDVLSHQSCPHVVVYLKTWPNFDNHHQKLMYGPDMMRCLCYFEGCVKRCEFAQTFSAKGKDGSTFSPAPFMKEDQGRNSNVYQIYYMFQVQGFHSQLFTFVTYMRNSNMAGLFYKSFSEREIEPYTYKLRWQQAPNPTLIPSKTTCQRIGIQTIMLDTEGSL